MSLNTTFCIMLLGKGFNSDSIFTKSKKKVQTSESYNQCIDFLSQESEFKAACKTEEFYRLTENDLSNIAKKFYSGISNEDLTDEGKLEDLCDTTAAFLANCLINYDIEELQPFLYESTEINGIRHLLIKENKNNAFFNYIKYLLNSLPRAQIYFQLSGLDINFKNPYNGFNIIHLVSLYGNVAVLDYFHKNGANLNAISHLGSAPLHFAANRGEINILEYLIINGADVDICDRYKSTPLHIAAENGNKNAIELLILSNANVNAEDIFGHTPLHRAVMKNNDLSIYELLINHGANINYKDKYNFTPFHLAVKLNDMNAVDFFLKEKISFDSVNQTSLPVLQLVVENENEYLLKKLQFLKLDQNMKNSDGLTPLHIAVMTNKLNMVKILINDMLADVNVKSKFGLTPLDFAVINDNLEILNCLIAKGANPFMIDDHNENIIHKLAKFGSVKCMNALIQYIKSIESKSEFSFSKLIFAKDASNTTPVSYAIQNNHTQIANILMHGSY